MGNPVGSLEVPIVLHARKQLVLELSKRQQEILIGCILGDAHIRPIGKIWIEQSVKQREYMEWKYNELSSLCYTAQPREISHTLSNGKEIPVIIFLLEAVFLDRGAIFSTENKKFSLAICRLRRYP